MNNLKSLQSIATPAYVGNIASISANMEKARRIKAQTGIKLLLATKAFAMPAVFPYMRETLDGTTASGLYEARLGATHFGSEEEGKEVHTYSPAYTEETLKEILKYSSHIYFNSIHQLKKFAPLVRATRNAAVIGLRVNPRLPLVKNSSLYDPSAPCSRFGVQKEELTEEILAQIDLLHVHNLCENLAEDSEILIEHVRTQFAFALPKIRHINLGGGHFYTHKNYDIPRLIAALKKLKQDFTGTVTLEPGAAHVLNGGYLVSTVLDIIPHAQKIAILDASASTHMPDVLEVPYTPEIIGAEIVEQEKADEPNTYILGGNTCMTGDVIGTYKFEKPLEIGQKIIFTDMMQYSFVKNTTFNGIPLPDLALLHEDGRVEIVKRFLYEDFVGRLG
ncbi:MAG: carboxynorspermidine decarboxylase [Alphaproteobacteria bacterium]|jgi:carboxynorspermidine decarboxylase|nr:carboxynorspermidine decarboxylase [Alphaproteobacteria bacterium]QQS58058.1 MAG: carboxynorspermidine decarboxylase [Alphaproteobacteria bacterium]